MKEQLVFRQLFDAETSTFSYLLGDQVAGVCVLIDPVEKNIDRDLLLIEQLGLRLIYSLETHCHADHVTAAWVLSQKCGAKIVVSKNYGGENAHILVGTEDVIKFGSLKLHVRETPGHTKGCVTYVLHDYKMAFTGDSLLIRGCGRTDFQQGNAKNLYNSVKHQIFTLSDDTLLYPAHDYNGFTVTTVYEEKNFNKRLRDGVDEMAFKNFMKNLRLSEPKNLEHVVPANLRFGKHKKQNISWYDELRTDLKSVEEGYRDGSGI